MTHHQTSLPGSPADDAGNTLVLPGGPSPRGCYGLSVHAACWHADDIGFPLNVRLQPVAQAAGVLVRDAERNPPKPAASGSQKHAAIRLLSALHCWFVLHGNGGRGA